MPLGRAVTANSFPGWGWVGHVTEYALCDMDRSNRGAGAQFLTGQGHYSVSHNAQVTPPGRVGEKPGTQPGAPNRWNAQSLVLVVKIYTKKAE